MSVDVKRVNLAYSDIPRQFNFAKPSEFCVKDIIAYVRGTVERDPWVPVVISSKDTPVAVRELEFSNIYWEGVNETKAAQHIGIGSISHCIIDISDLNPELEDCGFTKIVNDFASSYNVSGFEVLVTGNIKTAENLELMTKLRAFVVASDRDDVVFPTAFIKQNKLVTNGVDISVYAREIETQRVRNNLSAEMLDDILQQLNEQIRPDESVIQDLNECRTSDVKLLTTYLILKYNLPPVYVSSFVSEYIRYQFIYPFRQLSLYERVKFLRQMPQIVGYIGNHQNFTCYARVLEKIFPTPHYVFNLENMQPLDEEEIEDDAWNLNNPAIHLADFRGLFTGSTIALNYATSLGLGKTEESDAKVDRQLIDLFAALSKTVPEDVEQVYLSIKTCLFAERGGKRYIIYAPEECGIRAGLMSEYFGALERVISECEFHHLIDAQLEKALLVKERSSSIRSGNNALAVVWKSFDADLALKPAIDYDISLYRNMLPTFRNGLSYYDRLLRCYTDVLPIITTIGSKYNDIGPLFHEIPINALREDPQARYYISSCGTLLSSSTSEEVLPVTYNAFRHRRLIV